MSYYEYLSLTFLGWILLNQADGKYSFIGGIISFLMVWCLDFILRAAGI